MTVQPTRDQLRADVATGKALTGTYRADSDPDYYPAMRRIFEAAPRLLDQLEQAEARIEAVRDALDTYAYTGIYTGQERVAVSDIRRALEGGEQDDPS